MKTRTTKYLVTCVAFACFASFANAAAVNHLVDFRGQLTGNSPTGQQYYLSQSFTNPYTSSVVNFDVLVTLDWADSLGQSASGLTGTIFGNGLSLGANTRLGLNQADSGSVETVSTMGGMLSERLTFSVVNLPSDVTFVGYSNPSASLDGDETITGTTEYSIAAGSGGYRIKDIEATFMVSDPQAVPEPGTWLSFSLVVCAAVVALVRRRAATREAN